jgi:hypothetical protein
VNDIYNVNKSIKCVLNANDTCLLFSATSSEAVLALFNHVFASFSDWFLMNNLALNDKKSKCVMFNLRVEFAVLQPIKFNNFVFQQVSSLAYLGIIINIS